jgi:hypothetical protein
VHFLLPLYHHGAATTNPVIYSNTTHPTLLPPCTLWCLPPPPQAPEKFVAPDPEMAATLLDQKEAGKMLLLITNRWVGVVCVCVWGGGG